MNNLSKNQTDFTVVDPQWSSYPDGNNGQYSMNTVRFSSINVTSPGQERWFNYAAGFIAMPYSIAMTIATPAPGAVLTGLVTAAFDPTQTYAQALSHLGTNHFISHIELNVGGISAQRETTHLSLCRQESTFKMMESNKFKIFSQLCGYEMDNGESIRIVGGGESNQRIQNPTGETIQK